MGVLISLFSFHGRVSRARYWLTTGACGAISVMQVFSLGAASMPAAKGDPAASLGPSFVLLLLSLVSLAASVVSLATQVKRWHDRGRTGWLVLLPLAPLVMLIVELVGAAMNNTPPMQALGSMGLWLGVLGIINLWFFIELGCLAGTDGPNKYGDPPGSGGGYTPAAPSAPTPGQPAPKNAAAASSLFGAQAAIDRAIAEKSRVMPAQARPQAATPLRPAPAAPRAAQPAPSGGAPAFGRRVR